LYYVITLKQVLCHRFSCFLMFLFSFILVNTICVIYVLLTVIAKLCLSRIKKYWWYVASNGVGLDLVVIFG